MHRLLSVAIGGAVIAGIAIALVCGRHAPGPTAPVAGNVLRLSVSGAGPVLAWTPIEGSYVYQVAARGPDGAWLWEGTTTSVTFGTVEDQLDYLVPIDPRPVQVMIARPGATYRWFVTAFAAEDGSVAAVSPIQEFVYQPGAGEPPLRTPRRFEPSYACARLVPDSVRAGPLAGFTEEDGSPCGPEPRPGCPWDCTYHRARGDGGDHVQIYFDCRNSNAPWPNYPHLDHATPLAGLGASAEQSRKDDERVYRFHASAVACMVTVTSSLDEPTTLGLAHAVDANLTWERLRLRPPP